MKPFRNPTNLFVDGPKDGTTVTSARKEIGYDANSGRFFETDIDKEDCIPEDEYCVVDSDTGDMVRLTLEEKERIFLDALQVSASLILHRSYDFIYMVLTDNNCIFFNVNIISPTISTEGSYSMMLNSIC